MIEHKIIERALALLKAAKCKAYVVAEDGTVWNESKLEVVTPKLKKRTYEVPKGTACKLYKNRIENLKPGDRADFKRHEYEPLGFTPEHFRRTLTTAMHRNYKSSDNYFVALDESTGDISAIVQAAAEPQQQAQPSGGMLI